jgi:hypothetical protein
VAGSESGGVSTTPEFGWPLIEPTDFVTNLPADFESFADAVDDDLKGLKGGTTGQFLVKDSNSDLDFEWITPAGGGQGFTLLNAGGTSLTGSEVTISGINHEELLIIVTGASATTASQYIQFRFNSDSGTNYRYAGMQFIARGSYLSDVFQDLSENLTQINAVQMNNNAAAEMQGALRVTACKSTDLKTFTSVFGSSAPSSAANGLHRVFQGVYEGGSAITSVNIRTTGTFDAGTVRVYGSVS